MKMRNENGRKQNRRVCTVLTVVLSWVWCFSVAAAESSGNAAMTAASSKPSASAQKKSVSSEVPDKNKPKVRQKTVHGTVGYIRSDRMAVEFADGEELFLKMDSAKVKLNRIKSISQLSVGSQVEVSYDEIYRLPEKPGGPTRVTDRLVREIKLVTNAQKKELSS